MSAIGKKPIIETILAGLTEEQLTALKANLDANVIKDYKDYVDLYKNGTLGQAYVPTFNCIYIAPYMLKFEPDSQHLKPYILNSDGSIQPIDEKCTILELRSELNDRMIETGAISLGLVFTNVTVDNWVSDQTYADYPYKAEIACNGITANSVVEVIFALAQAISGNYAPICESSANKVTIYAKVNTTIVIPTIKEVL